MTSIGVFVLASPILLFAIWYITSTIAPPPPPPASTLQNKRIILLIAHPDDESMFFSPALQTLTNPSFGNHVKILCLSSGNADGLGETRKKELESAALTLGVRRREDVFVLEDDRFKDGMHEVWNEADIAKVLASAFAPQLTQLNPVPTENDKVKGKSRNNKNAPPSASSAVNKQPEGPRATIDVLVTFDSAGISSHPNHISLYHGARLFLKNMMKDHAGYACPVTLYVLPTINLVRKYTFILDVLPTYLSGILGAMVDGATGGGTNSKSTISKGTKGDRVIFVSDVARYWKAREAMVRGHRSQMVWFRWGWIGIGRYMVVNDLKRETVLAGS